MELPLTLLLFVICCLVLGYSLRNKAGFYQLPFFLALIFLVFVVPQLLSLGYDTTLPRGALGKVALMSVLCLVAALAGFSIGKTPLNVLSVKFDEAKLKWLAIVFIAVSAGCAAKLRSMPDARLMGQLSGTATALLFFFQCNVYALAISAFCYAHKRSRWAAICTTLSLMLYFDRVVIGGKRGDMAEACIVVLMAFWFSRRKAIPRGAAIAFVLVAFFLTNGISAYRQAMFKGVRYGTALQLDANLLDRLSAAARSLFSTSTVKHVLTTNAAYEMRTAAYMIHGHERHGQLNFGASHWNFLVFSFVPAQVFGQNFKTGLMLQVGNDDWNELLQFEKRQGVTRTGIATAYTSFGYLGCLEFLVIAWVMKRLYLGAVAGNPVSGIAYAVLVSPVMQTVTHSTSWVLSPTIHMTAFLLTGLYFCRQAQFAPESHANGPRQFLAGSGR